MKKTLSYLLIAAGLLLIAYPSINEYLGIRKQAALLESMNASYEQAAVPEEISNQPEEVEVSFETVYPVEDYDREDMAKILSIPKIELTVPIVEGISDANLKIAPARFETTRRPGEMGNFALAGHRYYTYGRDFNRLDEVAVGDKIEVFVGPSLYTYTVYEVLVVEPSEVWVLDDIPGMRTITLVTCTPIRVSTHRLIVRGELTNYEKVEKRMEN